MARDLAGAHCTLLEGFEEIKQPVSSDKAVFLANSVDLARDLEEQCDHTSGKKAAGTRHLGTDATNGNRRAVATARSREVEACQAAARAQALRKAGAATGSLVRAGPTAKALWGSAVSGLPDGRLHTLRLAALRAEGPLPKGASLGLRFKTYPRAGHRGPLLVNTAEVAKKHSLCV